MFAFYRDVHGLSATTVGVIVWLNLRVCAWVCVHTASLWNITKPWKYNLQGSYLDVAAPTFSLKTAILQLRLCYTTMWQSYTRANICDPDTTFKYSPIDRSLALLYLTTSSNANWCRPFSTNVSLALLLALLCCFPKRPLFKYWNVCILKWRIYKPVYACARQLGFDFFPPWNHVFYKVCKWHKRNHTWHKHFSFLFLSCCVFPVKALCLHTLQ